MMDDFLIREQTVALAKGHRASWLDFGQLNQSTHLL